MTIPETLLAASKRLALYAQAFEITGNKPAADRLWPEADLLETIARKLSEEENQ